MIGGHGYGGLLRKQQKLEERVLNAQELLKTTQDAELASIILKMMVYHTQLGLKKGF